MYGSFVPYEKKRIPFPQLDHEEAATFVRSLYRRLNMAITSRAHTGLD
jgi:hypothetical protein